MTIGTLAQRAQVPISTLRFYERRGLLSPATRTTSGYRRYSENDVRRVRFIRRAAELGFTLEELLELLTVSTNETMSHEQLVAYGERKVKALNAKIKDLERMKSALQKILIEGASKDPNQSCPVISSLG